MAFAFNFIAKIEGSFTLLTQKSEDLFIYKNASHENKNVYLRIDEKKWFFELLNCFLLAHSPQ